MTNIFQTSLKGLGQSKPNFMWSLLSYATAECIRNAVALRDPCDLTVSSDVPDVLGLPELLIEGNF